MRSRANLGKAWEGQVLAAAERYTYERRGYWYRIPEPFRALGRAQKGGQFLAVRTATAQPDLGGCWMGRSVLLDAKDCRAARWPLSDLRAHQAEAFTRLEAVGGLGGVLLRLQGVGWLLPWSGGLGAAWAAWSAGKAQRGGASLTAADCERMGVAFVGAHWMPALEAL